jgi:predicted trehalose synthase
MIIDFEGEPARGLTERRLKASPLRDVAGMLRSFTYAVSVSGIDDPELERTVRERFLESYYEAMRPTGVLPPRETAERLIRIFELEKAVYELGYELEHRPDWVAIPVAGIVRLLAE